MDNKTIDEIVSHMNAIDNILYKEKTRPKEKEKLEKVWEVYWLDEVWVLDRDTLRTYANWEDAYKYYKELGQGVMNEYKKNNDRLKRPTVINDFTPRTYFLDSEYPEFWIDNKEKWNCHIRWEYEECILQESFIM